MYNKLLNYLTKMFNYEIKLLLAQLSLVLLV